METTGENPRHSNAATEIYVISCERYETLALTLAGLCGFNRLPGVPIHVVDDASRDPRVQALLAGLLAGGHIDTLDVLPIRSGIKIARRRVIDRFLGGGADCLVQVEGDVLLPPGAIETLRDAYRVLHEPAGEDILPAWQGYGPIDRVNWLCAFRHEWVHQTMTRPPARVGYGTGGGAPVYSYTMARGGSEPFWITSRDVLEPHQALCPATRPDLVLFLRAVGAAVLTSPEIQCQHIGAVNSFYYAKFAPPLVTYFNADGKLRQPYPNLFELDFPAVMTADLTASREAFYLTCANVLWAVSRGVSPDDALMFAFKNSCENTTN
jgi:hypothetical protein